MKSLLTHCPEHGDSRRLLLCLNKCVLCGRDTPKFYLEKHHLIPSNKKSETIQVCCDCADQIHKLFTNKELENTYNSFETILNSEKIQTWIKWIKNKPNDFSVCMRRKK